jgi:type IV secretory pathway TrbL component
MSGGEAFLLCWVSLMTSILLFFIAWAMKKIDDIQATLDEWTVLKDEES